ncbi:uncharacterized protein ACN2A1_002864 isoform 2-T2 [Glossina fuscipes fuscipes]
MGIIHEKELKGAVEGIPNEVEKIDPEKRKEKPEQLGEDKKGKEEIAPGTSTFSYLRLKCPVYHLHLFHHMDTNRNLEIPVHSLNCKE